MSFFFLFLVSVGFPLITGCVATIEGKNGEVHHVILGIGVVTTKDSPEDAIRVTDTQALGISLSDRPNPTFAIGFSSSLVTSVEPNAKDIRVDVSKSLWGTTVIDVQNAQLLPKLTSSERRAP